MQSSSSLLSVVNALLLISLMFQCSYGAMSMKEEKLLKRDKLPFCTNKNLNLADSSQVQWVLQPDGSFRIRMPNCIFRRPRVDKIRSCLRGTHVLFMGDSISRYLYLSLAHMVARAVWPPRFSNMRHPEYPKSILTEKDFGSWGDFYSVSNSILTGLEVRPEYGEYVKLKTSAVTIELCNCHRREREELDINTVWNDAMMENRYFRYVESGDWNSRDDVRLSYLQWLGHANNNGHDFFPNLMKYSRNSSFITEIDKANKILCANTTLVPITQECMDRIISKNSYRKDPSFLRNHDEYGTYMFLPMSVTHGILNLGQHDSFHDDHRDYMKIKLSKLGKMFYVSPDNRRSKQLKLPKVTWRTVNAHSPHSEDNVMRNLSESIPNSMAYFDILNMTAKLHTINFHYHPNQGYYDAIKTPPFFIKSKKWPSNRPVDNVTLPFIYVDHVHYEPWVYNEINMFMIVAACPDI